MSTDLNLVPTGGKLTTGTSWRERFGGLGGNARQYGIFAALVVLVNLAVDIVYAFIDPRIRVNA